MVEDFENNDWVQEVIDRLHHYLLLLDELGDPKVEAGYSISCRVITPEHNTETNAIMAEAIITDIEKYLQEHSSLQE